jgi:pimeloyl-ACP methyl ester carboxylesterase
MSPVISVVLVHGAWVDGSAWGKVIPILKSHGLNAAAVQLTWVSLELDVAATKRIIDAQDGQVLLVGHSYGGAVITEAGINPKVSGLAYIAARAPEAGESTMAKAVDYPTAEVFQEVRPIADGYLVLTEKGVKEYFAQDLTSDEKDLLVSTQGQAHVEVLNTPLKAAAWTSKPSWVIVSANDKTIRPEEQKDTAKRLNARRTLVLSASHVPMMSQPENVADFLIDAVKSLNG